MQLTLTFNASDKECCFILKKGKSLNDKNKIFDNDTLKILSSEDKIEDRKRF